MAEPLEFRTQGRSPRTVLAVGIAVCLLLGLWAVHTVPWIIAVLALPVLPAVWDLLRNPAGVFEMTDDTVRWKTSGQQAEIALGHIEKARFDTRWDFSVRVTLILAGKRKQRIPQNVMPPHLVLEKGFADRGIAVERHHFRVI